MAPPLAQSPSRKLKPVSALNAAGPAACWASCAGSMLGLLGLLGLLGGLLGLLGLLTPGLPAKEPGSDTQLPPTRLPCR